MASPCGRGQRRQRFFWQVFLGVGAAASGGEAAASMMASGVRGCTSSSLAAWVARRRWVVVVAWGLLRRPLLDLKVNFFLPSSWPFSPLFWAAGSCWFRRSFGGGGACETGTGGIPWSAGLPRQWRRPWAP
jgi:hypothetical protein